MNKLGKIEVVLTVFIPVMFVAGMLFGKWWLKSPNQSDFDSGRCWIEYASDGSEHTIWRKE